MSTPVGRGRSKVQVSRGESRRGSASVPPDRPMLVAATSTPSSSPSSLSPSTSTPPFSSSTKPPTPSKFKRTSTSPEQGSPTKKFKVTPSDASRDDFQLCNPLVFIHTGIPKNNNANKFSGGKMNVEAVKTFFALGPARAIRRTLQAFSRSVGEELKYRAALCQLFPAFHMLAKHGVRIMDLTRDNTTQSEQDDKSSQGTSSQSVVLSQESNQSSFIHHAIHESGEALEGKQSVDFLIQSIPKKVMDELREDQLYWEDDEDIGKILADAENDSNSWKNEAFLDAKDATLSKFWLKKYAYQIGIYGGQFAMDNIDKGFVRPIYGFCISDFEWRLAILDSYGAVTVKDNGVTLESYETFKQQFAQRVAWFKKKGAPSEVVNERFSNESIQHKLLMSRKLFARHNYSGIPDGRYVVGTYYIDDEEHSWDGSLKKLNNTEVSFSNGTIHLIEGLLRVFVGNKILTWTKEGIIQAFKEIEEKEETWCFQKAMK